MVGSVNDPNKNPVSLFNRIIGAWQEHCCRLYIPVTVLFIDNEDDDPLQCDIDCCTTKQFIF